MPAMYYECSSDEQIRRCLVELAPRTAVVDVEPLIAYWDTGTEELDEGLARFLLEVRSVPSLEAVVFATNSFRRPSNPPQVAGVAYHARALKPFITKTFRHLPRPGVVLGDQTATDGVLAYRLGYTFVRYKPPTETMKLGPKLMAALGVAVRPIFLSRPHPPATD